jgi:PIN like domain
VNFLLDNNLPASLATALGALSVAEPGVQSIVHLSDLFPPATDDLVWIPGLSQHGADWYVVSQDKFRKSKGPPISAPSAALATRPTCSINRG